MSGGGTALISGVRPGSLADEAGIAPGDELLEVGGRAPRDVIDVQFYSADEVVAVRVRKPDGTDDLIEFEKDIDEDLGFEFEAATFDGVDLCNNNCFFCFLKGLPKGMRKSLYLKDDDYRLSFLHGNFVTLTNLAEDDWRRLEEQRLSPLNVSVHATELELRRSMLSNQKAPDILEQLRRLGDLGLSAHTQIVLCPGVNDGEHLRRSVTDLAALYPTVQTVSVVPVGASPKLEDWSLSRDGIALEPPRREYAREVIATLVPVQRQCRRLHGRTVVQCSDEYYLTAGLRVPGAATYDGFPQYENGIGMVRTLLDDWARTRARLRRQGPAAAYAARRLAIGCGTLIAPLMREIAVEFAELTGVAVDVYEAVNAAFGTRVNVSGLVPGEDWIRTLSGRDGEIAVLPRTTLDYFGERFLDGITVPEMAVAMGRPVGYAARWSEVLAIAEAGPSPPGRGAASNGAMWSN